MMDPKELKKLADACRKAGITSFKNSECEFTLAPEVPKSSYKKKKEYISPNSPDMSLDPFSTDTLTEEALLMWSTAPLLDESHTTEGTSE